MPNKIPTFRGSWMPTLPTPLPRSKQYDRQRGSAAKRGYDHKWRAVRILKLQRNPFCQDCEAAGFFLMPATEPHHIKKVSEFPELRLDIGNLISLCKSCHSKRTRRGE